MKYRVLLLASVICFTFLSTLTVGVIVYSQRQRPREDIANTCLLNNN
jgi:hypothetical protein